MSVKKLINELIRIHGGGNVTSRMVERHTGRNHADICSELGVKRFGEYMDSLSYKVVATGNRKRMRRADRMLQFMEAGLVVCENMTLDEITGHTICHYMGVSTALFWRYFESVESYKTALIKHAESKGVQIC